MQILKKNNFCFYCLDVKKEFHIYGQNSYIIIKTITMDTMDVNSTDDVEATNFENKRKMIFDCLNEASERLVGTSLEQKSSPEKRQRTTHDTQDNRITKFSGRESIFKRPSAPIAKCLKSRHVPDYQLNPHKWRKYSLCDADISERSNTSAAFAFLKEIEDRKSAADCDDLGDDDTQGDKIVFNSRKRRHTGAKFNKSVHLKPAEDETNVDPVIDLPKMRGSKVVMPEYVIGQKKERKKSSGQSSTDRAGKKSSEVLKLNHLFEEEEEEEDE
ncbi:Protein TSSC4 [Pseudolycoriella hygida]|uniref:U5 small nuclear ribonucleoprotein TSSC4 n=1 Tax=Pseudolycoriella hygida TaxID=35572 RepID=A0A9Q0N6X7_9DIPT|nr:Protein TSSC4 [Pseudolycoriella hygida]